MWRRLSSALTVLTMASGLTLVVGGPATAAVVTTTVGGVVYQADDAAQAAGASVVEVTDAAPKALTIPATVQIGSTTYAVTSVGTGAASDSALTSLVLPASLRTVGESAFLENDLTTLSLPDSVTSVGNLSFGNNEITALDLSDTLRTVDFGAFAGNRLTTVTLPASLVVIGSGAFSFNQLAAVTIPAAVTSIGDAAFSVNPLTSVLFTGPAPTTFTPAGGSAVGSLGDGAGLTVSYPARFAAPAVAGGYTSPTWQGYASRAVPTVPPVTPPVTPPTPPTPPGTTRPAVVKITQVKKIGARNRVVRLRVTVRNTGSTAASAVAVRFKNRPAGVSYPERQVDVGTLAPGASSTVLLKARRPRARVRLTVAVRTADGTADTRRVSLPRRR